MSSIYGRETADGHYKPDAGTRIIENMPPLGQRQSWRARVVSAIRAHSVAKKKQETQQAVRR